MRKPSFSLVEIIIVISVLAALFAIAIPSLSRFSARLSLHASAKALASELRKTQSQAVSQHKNLSFAADTFKLPAGIKFVKICKISFSASGSSPPGGSGTLVLQNKFGGIKKIIISSSGRVRIE